MESINNTFETIIDSWANCSVPLSHSTFSDFIFIYLFPPTLAICIVGNIFNLFVYALPFLRASTTIRLLSAKAIANCAYMAVLAANLLDIFARRSGSPFGVSLLKIYWRIISILFFVANTCGTVACWITVMITLEGYVAIAMPVLCKTLSTLRNAHCLIVCLFISAFVLHLIFIVNRSVIECFCDLKTNCHPLYPSDVEVIGTKSTNTTIDLNITEPTVSPLLVSSATFSSSISPIISTTGYNSTQPPVGPGPDLFDTRNYFYYFDANSGFYERVYNIMNSFLAVLLPVVILSVLTILLNYKLYQMRAKGMVVQPNACRSTTEQKACINRLALATTFAHLALEGPQVVILVIATAFDNAATSHPIFLYFVSISNYLSMLNASIPFLIYYACSHRFRSLFAYVHCSRLCPLSAEDKAFIDNKTQQYERSKSTQVRIRSGSQKEMIRSRSGCFNESIATTHGRFIGIPARKRTNSCVGFSDRDEPASLISMMKMFEQVNSTGPDANCMFLRPPQLYPLRFPPRSDANCGINTETAQNETDVAKNGLEKQEWKNELVDPNNTGNGDMLEPLVTLTPPENEDCV